jgi:hypothetical protein
MMVNLLAIAVCFSAISNQARIDDNGISVSTSEEASMPINCVSIIVPTTKPDGLMHDARILQKQFRCAKIFIADDPEGAKVCRVIAL